MKFAVWRKFHARCASSKIATCSTGGPGFDQRVIPKVMNVLDEGLDAFGNFTLPHSNTLIFLPCNFVTGQGFAKHSNQWTVPGKKYSMSRLIHVAGSSGKVESNECLTGSRHPRNKTN